MKTRRELLVLCGRRALKPDISEPELLPVVSGVVVMIRGIVLSTTPDTVPKIGEVLKPPPRGGRLIE
jgi:hypothetical protein